MGWQEGEKESYGELQLETGMASRKHFLFSLSVFIVEEENDSLPVWALSLLTGSLGGNSCLATQ